MGRRYVQCILKNMSVCRFCHNEKKSNVKLSIHITLYWLVMFRMYIIKLIRINIDFFTFIKPTLLYRLTYMYTYGCFITQHEYSPYFGKYFLYGNFISNIADAWKQPQTNKQACYLNTCIWEPCYMRSKLF